MRALGQLGDQVVLSFLGLGLLSRGYFTFLLHVPEEELSNKIQSLAGLCVKSLVSEVHGVVDTKLGLYNNWPLTKTSLILL